MVSIKRFARIQSALVALLFVLGGCAKDTGRVSIPPDPLVDQAPIISLSAMPYLPPSVPGEVGAISASQFDSVAGQPLTQSTAYVEPGTFVQFIANASNAHAGAPTGGVQSLSFRLQNGDFTIFERTVIGTPDAAGKVPRSLVIADAPPEWTNLWTIAGSPNLKAYLYAANFTGGSTTLEVSFVPRSSVSAGVGGGGPGGPVIVGTGAGCTPKPETCNQKDDNCDGKIDNLSDTCETTVVGGCKVTGKKQCDGSCKAVPNVDYCVSAGVHNNGMLNCGLEWGNACSSNSECAPNMQCLSGVYYTGNTKPICLEQEFPCPELKCWKPADLAYERDDKCFAPE